MFGRVTIRLTFYAHILVSVICLAILYKTDLRQTDGWTDRQTDMGVTAYTALA